MQSVLKQALLQTIGAVLLPEFLPSDLPLEVQHSSANRLAAHFRPGTTLAQLEREAIQQCLSYTGGNRQQTAELLGISARTLLRKIRGYKLEDPLRPPPTSDEAAPPRSH